MDRLVPPAERSTVDVERDERIGEEVVARAAARPRVGIPDAEVDEPAVRIDRRRRPHRRAAVLPLVAGPRTAAEVAVAGAGVEAPQLRARRRVECRHRAAHAHLAARYADDHLVVEVERRERHRPALLPPRVPYAPQNAARSLVESHELAGDLGDEHLAVADRDAAVAEPAAYGRDRLHRNVRVVHPKLLSGRGVEREDVVVSGRDVHHALVDDRRCLLRVRARAAALQVDLPGELQLADVRRVDSTQRRVAIVRRAAAVRDPVIARGRREVCGVERRCERDGRSSVPVPAAAGGNDERHCDGDTADDG